MKKLWIVLASLVVLSCMLVESADAGPFMRGVRAVGRGAGRVARFVAPPYHGRQGR